MLHVPEFLPVWSISTDHSRAYAEKSNLNFWTPFLSPQMMQNYPKYVGMDSTNAQNFAMGGPKKYKIDVIFSREFPGINI